MSNNNKVWCSKEVNVIEEHYPKSEKKILLSLLPNRTWIQIEGKAIHLEIKRERGPYRKYKWSRDELKELRKSGKTQREIADELGANVNTLRRYLNELNVVWYKTNLTRKPSFNPSDWRKEDSGYIAGMLDGEGSIVFNISTNYVVNVAVNTNKAVIQTLSTWLNAPCEISNRKTVTRKTVYSVTIRKTIDVYVLLKHLLPLLIVKQDKARKALEYSYNKLKEDNIETEGI